jgi:hypothetical protein
MVDMENNGVHAKEGGTTFSISEEMGVVRMTCKVHLFELFSGGKVEKYVVSRSIFFGSDIADWRLTD